MVKSLYKFFFIVLGVLFSNSSFAQNNVFPASGNVGIATLAPAAKLDIFSAYNSNQNIGFKMFYQGSWGIASYATSFRFLDIASTEGGKILQLNGYGMGLGYDPPAYASQDKLYVNGNVGIGTATPEGTLELKKLNAGLVFDLNTNGLTKIISKGWNSSVDFSTFKISGIQNQNQLHLNTDGNVGIGTSIPKEKLSVNGKIRAQEIKVETSNWPDYVFEEDYRLRSLAELRAFIEQRKHLPEIPTAKEAEYEGIALGEMNKLLLKKVEELTLYLLEKDKELSEVKKQMLETTKELNGKLEALSLKLLVIENTIKK